MLLRIQLEKGTFMRKVLMIVCLFAVTGFITGCSNTLEGAGRDIERAGQKVQDTF